MGIGPRTGIAYLPKTTSAASSPDPNEAPPGTRVSFLYRYIPNDWTRRSRSFAFVGTPPVFTQSLPACNPRSLTNR
jgi:hypothetical protein